VVFTKAEWAELPGWREDDVAEAWPALLASCSVLGPREFWREPCEAAKRVLPPSSDSARAYFERQFTPYRVASADSGDQGLITGYYEPLLRGSRTATQRYRYPIYRVPDDLVVVDLGAVYPELQNMRLRGRVDGRRVVPYAERAQIDGPDTPLVGKEIAWVDDAIDLFFLHIQGSGRIMLDSGQALRVGYAEQNGHPYRAIGRVLIDRGELTREEVSMQSIKAWLRGNPAKAGELLNTNPSYVFFRELPATGDGPPGALGVPLTPRRSIAVDPRHVPLGAPVFISTNWPNSSRALNRITFAQDTGGAVRGAVRADFFWGAGETAEREAGQMKEPLRMWVLLPHRHPVPADEKTN
jgi:membrane-bound lytic murein transglycosylase A